MSIIHNNQKSFSVIGIMSGTSLDGLDICLCNFTKNDNKWRYSIKNAYTEPYPAELKEQLISVFNKSGSVLTKLDYKYGKWIGKQVMKFLENIDSNPDFIASHGHTIFHKPNEGFTLQIGKGSAISAESGLPCICDFRSSDVCHSGQGAPLVPIGDRYLFSDYDICLNLGGFANLSFEKENQRIAFDIAPCNIILNSLALKLGQEYDKNGELGQSGLVNDLLFEELNTLDYYHKSAPKSLGREWFEEIFLPVLEKSNLQINDILRTVYEHISYQICSTTNGIKGEKILITGGGAHNNLLIHLIKNKSNHLIVIPDNQTIDYKEAVIFAFLGVLYILKEPGALSSVTGANTDSISGCLYY